jgi:fucose 4-O-acetylase-like acetyltransferase
LKQINAGIDPLFALKFTKLVVIPFGFLVNLSLITMILPTRNFFTELVSKLLAWLGENSFLIFLSHTVGLRFIYAISMRQLDLSTLMGAILMWIITIYLSLKILNEKKTKAVIPQ